jgi:hypothetical protein
VRYSSYSYEPSMNPNLTRKIAGVAVALVYTCLTPRYQLWVTRIRLFQYTFRF